MKHKLLWTSETIFLTQTDLFSKNVFSGNSCHIDIDNLMLEQKIITLWPRDLVLAEEAIMEGVYSLLCWD